ncbi:MAG: MBL fold metallo-hydrolase [Oscillospiraceae bacterium]|nr:MBL fold metallo-hydrolase [Oscillospiraceae bacterium]MCI9549470.1 MBL fold metallo-hydrolase [Oscillospiraceae bacterium]
MEISVLRLGQIGTNCYIFRRDGGYKCGVVDPGDQGEQVARWLVDKGLEAEAVLLTHGHFDHILGIPGLREEWPDLPVYCHSADLGQGDATAAFGQTFPTVRSFGDITPYQEGDAIDVAGIRVEVLETPGHTPGSVTLRAEDVLFTGDTLFAGSMGRTDLPGGDEGQIMASLRRLAGLEGDYQVLPGHESRSTLERERQSNYCVRAALRG